ncbi:MAG TPA: DUF4215 domain-containing protein [Polyangiaceae bacterium]|nr:DUF4215 domain-containing protein [Polyangiaceae bacterium]
MSARKILGLRVGKWFVPGLSVAAALVMFASCTAETRTFGNGHHSQNHGDAGSQQDAATADAGGDATVDSGSNHSDSGTAIGNECDGKADGVGCGQMSGFICVNQGCRESSCGDGYVDDALSEECDDGNTDPNDGCEPGTCTFSCNADGDCNDQDPCNGVETCDNNHACLAGTAPDTTLQVPCVLDLPPVSTDAGASDAGNAADSGTAPASGDASLTDSGSISSPDATVAADAGNPLAGICKAGACVLAGCGNGVLQAGEQCDDGNDVNSDGCKNDCKYTCEADSDCDDHDVCTGSDETCNTHNHRCVAGTPLTCDDSNDCTDNTCDPILGCLYPVIDADGDGHASTDIGACGDDCNDNDETIYLGAAELCDGKDNDCDTPPQVDEAAPFWYLDCDGDGFAEQGAPSVQGCNAPAPQAGCSGAGWTTNRPVNGDYSTIDCFDSNASAYPSSDPSFPFSTTAVPGKGSLPYDWNCDNTQEKQYHDTYVSTSASCSSDNCGIIFLSQPSAAPAKGTGDPQGLNAAQTSAIGPIYYLCCGAAGYQAYAPACGASAAYTYCSGAGGCYRVTDYQQTQECR